jgi:putative flavoprotein involved in K+ transport
VLEASNQVSVWLADFEAALQRADIPAVQALFVDECYWRDQVAFTWNILTLEGPGAIGAMLGRQLAGIRPSNWTIDGGIESSDGVIEARLRFETASGRGRAFVRLKDGRCWTLLTALDELKGFEERSGRGRVNGVQPGAVRGRRTWREVRDAEELELGIDRQPYCVIIGGGQGGIALGARLRRLGVSHIVLDKNPRAGDTWRNRYRSLVLHDPVWYDHLPYMPFPDDWPVFSPKDKFGDWLEMYARVMEVNYWGSTECTGAAYDETTGEWRAQVRRDGRLVELRPKHLVFATGAYGPPKRPGFPGADSFAGTLIHSSDYSDGAAWRGRKCVVIGAGSSAHDIAADLWEHEAKVTMIQRSPTIVVKSETLTELGFGPLYSEEALERGITTEIADLMSDSIPLALMPSFVRPVYEKIRRRDGAFYKRLGDAGFQYDFGEDQSGILMRALRTGSGYYIDVGTSELICSGEIAITSGVGVAALDGSSVVLDNGSRIDADLVVCATGFHSMDETVASLISRRVADKVGSCWGIGSGVPGDPGPWLGELRNLWKPTAQPNLWFHGGNLALSRRNSLLLALQIKARMEGLELAVYGAPSS